MVTASSPRRRKYAPRPESKVIDEDKFLERYLTNGLDKADARHYVKPVPGKQKRQLSHKGKRILDRPPVQERMERIMTKVTDKLEVTAERVVRQLARIAFLDVGDLFHADGRPKNISEIPADVRQAIRSVSVRTDALGDIHGLAFESRLKALNLLGKMLAMWVERKEITDKTDTSRMIPLTELEDRIALLTGQPIEREVEVIEETDPGDVWS